MQAMILAAGLGTRLKPYSEFCPKPLFPILGKPLLLYQLEQLRHYGFSSIRVNAHHLYEQFVTILADECVVSLQIEDDILGTGGGLRMALPDLAPEPLLVMNGDTLHSFDLSEVMSRHISSGSLVSMVVHDYPVFNNVLVSGEGLIKEIRATRVSEKNATGDKLKAFTGIHVINPEVLVEIPKDEFFDVITLYQHLIGSMPDKISAIEMDKRFWTDIGTPADYLTLHGDILTGALPGSLKKMFPEVSGPKMVMPDVVGGENVTYHDWSYVGSGVRIGNDVSIARSVIWDGAVIEDGASIEDRIIVR